MNNTTIAASDSDKFVSGEESARNSKASRHNITKLFI